MGREWRRGDEGFDVLAEDIEVRALNDGVVLAETADDGLSVGEDRFFLQLLIFLTPELFGLQLTQSGAGAPVGGLVHFPVAVHAVELPGEFVIEEGIVESAGNGFVLNLQFEQEAAADVPGGVEDELEVMELGLAGGL